MSGCPISKQVQRNDIQGIGLWSLRILKKEPAPIRDPELWKHRLNLRQLGRGEKEAQGQMEEVMRTGDALGLL